MTANVGSPTARTPPIPPNRSQQHRNADKVRQVLFGGSALTPGVGRLRHAYEFVGPETFHLQLACRIIFFVVVSIMSAIFAVVSSRCGVSIFNQLAGAVVTVNKAAFSLGQISGSGIDEGTSIIENASSTLAHGAITAAGVAGSTIYDEFSRYVVENSTVLLLEAWAGYFARLNVEALMEQHGLDFVEVRGGADRGSVSRRDRKRSLEGFKAGDLGINPSAAQAASTFNLSSSLYADFFRACAICADSLLYNAENHVWDFLATTLWEAPPYSPNCSAAWELECVSTCFNCTMACYELLLPSEMQKHSEGTTTRAENQRLCDECPKECNSDLCRKSSYCMMYYDWAESGDFLLPSESWNSKGNMFLNEAQTWGYCATWPLMTSYSLAEKSLPAELVSGSLSTSPATFLDFITSTTAILDQSCDSLSDDSAKVVELNADCRVARSRAHVAEGLVAATLVFAVLLLLEKIGRTFWITCVRREPIQMTDVVAHVMILSVVLMCDPYGLVLMLHAHNDGSWGLDQPTYGGLESLFGQSARPETDYDWLWSQVFMSHVVSYTLAKACLNLSFAGLAVSFRNVHHAPFVDFCRSVQASGSVVRIVTTFAVYVTTRLTVQLAYDIDVGAYPLAAAVSLARICSDYTQNVVLPSTNHDSCFDDNTDRFIAIIVVIVIDVTMYLFASYEVHRTRRFLVRIPYELSRSCHLGNKLLSNTLPLFTMSSMAVALPVAGVVDLFYSYADYDLCCACVYSTSCRGLQYDDADTASQFVYPLNLKTTGLYGNLAMGYVMQVTIFVAGWLYLLRRRVPPPLDSSEASVIIVSSEPELQDMLANEAHSSKHGLSLSAETFFLPIEPKCRFLLLPRTLAFDTLFDGFQAAFGVYGDLDNPTAPAEEHDECENGAISGNGAMSGEGQSRSRNGSACDAIRISLNSTLSSIGYMGKGVNSALASIGLTGRGTRSSNAKRTFEEMQVNGGSTRLLHRALMSGDDSDCTTDHDDSPPTRPQDRAGLVISGGGGVNDERNDDQRKVGKSGKLKSEAEAVPRIVTVDEQRGGPAINDRNTTLCVLRVPELHSVVAFRGTVTKRNVKTDLKSYRTSELGSVLGEKLPNNSELIIRQLTERRHGGSTTKGSKRGPQRDNTRRFFVENIEKATELKDKVKHELRGKRKSIAFNFERRTLKLHAGFIQSWNAIEDRLIQLIHHHAIVTRHREGKRPLPVLCSGHSLGGALATVCALAITLRLRLRTLLFTFGSPNVGNAAFARVFKHAVPAAWRCVHVGDPIASTPPFPYYPVGCLILLRRNGTLMANPNSLEANVSVRFSVSGVNNHLMGSYVGSLLAWKIRRSKRSQAQLEWTTDRAWQWFEEYLTERWKPDPQVINGGLVRFQLRVIKERDHRRIASDDAVSDCDHALQVI